MSHTVVIHHHRAGVVHTFTGRCRDCPWRAGPVTTDPVWPDSRQRSALAAKMRVARAAEIHVRERIRRAA